MTKAYDVGNSLLLVEDTIFGGITGDASASGRGRSIRSDAKHSYLNKTLRCALFELAMIHNALQWNLNFATFQHPRRSDHAIQSRDPIPTADELGPVHIGLLFDVGCWSPNLSSALN